MGGEIDRYTIMLPVLRDSLSPMMQPASPSVAGGKIGREAGKGRARMRRGRRRAHSGGRVEGRAERLERSERLERQERVECLACVECSERVECLGCATDPTHPTDPG